MLDVGAGTGNATLPAAATGAQVIGTDIAPELMAVGERAARARGLSVTWQVADAQALPFPDAAFDVVLSVVGAMFAPDHEGPPASCCGSAGRAARSRWRTGRPRARWAGSSRSSPATARPGRARRRRRGAIPRPSPGCSRPATVTTTRSHVRLAFDGPPAELVAYYRAHFPPMLVAFGTSTTRSELDAELVDLYSGGYDLEYLTVLAVTPPTGAPRGAPTGRSG